MSNGKGLGILALLIGISGLGLGVYTLVLPQVQVVDTNFGIQNTWFKYDPTTYPISSLGIDIIIDPLTINFTVNSGESVYFLFNTFAIISGTGLTILWFRFVLDGSIKGPPTYPEVYFASESVEQHGSVTLQFAKVISAGFHNLTISIRGTHTTMGIKDSTLLVQTYIP
ncbi:MAG: hypothetical protein JSV23_02285 [Promethearchaeota archaeon]|nr:MAG: hypothetical protein JSV23_02285 [Candidatus Lokiarchaeota archaeon]